MSKKLIVMVSSTVYGVEELLDRVYSLLTAFGYEVWMSHKGTVPVSSNETAFESCLRAVEKCDLFLGIITPQYGSGVDATGLSITHKEMKKALVLNKPRWFLAHDQVVFARRLLLDLGYKTQEERAQLTLKKGAASISNLKVIDLYEDATMEQLPLDDRHGNWVQKFERDDDANLFVVAQFSRYQDLELRLTEHFQDVTTVAEAVGERHE
ncbi:DUF4062 domain-containing protein [Yersinia enterocolitica]|nr:DUF4062 domain-containing protein [Yersinia enterocolitica]EKN5982557.1 DUF4062 domain-containing protein [Yersinia enterocolitica]EKN5986640.1 DUF4062 domain-containing protein [Yersinia enterocolitica]ELX2240250.1 DUF4062 domain-containing protein [Yersinia enterocolitica]HDL6714209.1 DUF4062 domain-containing protein [Yersinia enterocolitica]